MQTSVEPVFTGSKRIVDRFFPVGKSAGFGLC